MKYWWLSFVSDDDKFIGVCIVKASEFTDAVMKTHELKINPGGQVAGWPFEEFPSEFKDKYLSMMDKLLTKEQLEEVCKGYHLSELHDDMRNMANKEAHIQ